MELHQDHHGLCKSILQQFSTNGPHLTWSGIGTQNCEKIRRKPINPSHLMEVHFLTRRIHLAGGQILLKPPDPNLKMPLLYYSIIVPPLSDFSWTIYIVCFPYFLHSRDVTISYHHTRFGVYVNWSWIITATQTHTMH